MGDFNFGEFQQLFEYLQGKLNQGGALTPEEQQSYDGLMAIANQGLNLTNTADFNSLYKAFNALADDATKQKFEELYGTGLLQDPKTGAIQFTRPGTLIAAQMRRGLSVKDGPIQAMLSEGLKNFMDVTAKNAFAAMTNAYQAMTPIRGQNIQALNAAGDRASTAIGRLVPIAASAMGGARGGSAGDAAGPGGADLPVPPGPPVPSLLDKILPGLLTALAGGGLGILGSYLKKGPENDPTSKFYTGEQLDAAANQIVSRSRGPDQPYSSDVTAAPGGVSNPLYENRAERINPYQVDQTAFTGQPLGANGSLSQYDTYGINQAAFQGYPSTDPFNIGYQNYQQPGYAMNQLDPYASYMQPGNDTQWANTNTLDPGQYYGMSSQAWSSPTQQPYNYSDYYSNQNDYWSGAGGGGGGWSGGDTSSGPVDYASYAPAQDYAAAAPDYSSYNDYWA